MHLRASALSSCRTRLASRQTRRSGVRLAFSTGRPTPLSTGYIRFNYPEGDTITFSALAQWKQNAAAGGSSATPFVLAGAAAGVNTLSQRGADGQTTIYPTGSPNWLSLLAAGLGFTLGQGNQPASLGQTSLEGWIKYRVLDEQGNEVATGRDYLLGTGKWEYLQTGVRIAQNGTIEVMAGTSGTGEAVYFDNLRVEQTGGLIVQEQHQYAFGAPLPGLSYTVGNRRYRYGYQGQYAEHDSLTGFDSFELRLYNSRIGRWLSYDPEGQFSSPYVGMGNNPVSGVDPDGGSTIPVNIAANLAKNGLLISSISNFLNTMLPDVAVIASRISQTSGFSMLINPYMSPLIRDALAVPYTQPPTPEASHFKMPFANMVVSSEYFRTNGKFHGGLDGVSKYYGTVRGTDIHAEVSGTAIKVVKKLDGNGGGIRVGILDEITNRTIYNMHMIVGSNNHMNIGSHVNQGDVIGKVGGSHFYSANEDAGFHAHLHIQVMNPDGSYINPNIAYPELQELPAQNGKRQLYLNKFAPVLSKGALKK